MGYAIQHDGKLMPMMGSLRSLGYGGKTPPFVFEAPGQIDFSPDGKKLVVIEKGIKAEDHSTHKIHVFGVDGQGMVSDKATTSISYGHFPFASAFTPRGQLLVVEVFGKGPVMKSSGAASSYKIDADDCLKVISGSVDTLHNEACWVALAGPYAYITNFASGVITGYRVGEDGSLRRLNENGMTFNTGDKSFPTDLAASPDGRYLYALLPGLQQVGIYQVNMDGSLSAMSAAKGDWPVHIQGIAVR
jgi:6-phosphogluconolactonase (cycloisomerase 2 family)